MKRKFLALSLCLIILFSLIPMSCGKAENNKPINYNISFIKNLTANIGDAKALGIKREKIPAAKKNNPAAGNVINNLFSPEFLNAAALDGEEPDEKNYLVYTTEEVSNDGIPIDNINKVTFTKTTTEIEEVYDANGSLIEDNQTVSQDELPVQVDKVYVCGDFTFIRFLPLTENRRPEHLVYDEDGVAQYDKEGYETFEPNQTFVINNISGYIYKLESSITLSFESGFIKPYYNTKIYYDFFVNEDNEFVIESVLPHPTAEIENIYRDSYGYTFVFNNMIDDIDIERKRIYISNPAARYYVDNQNNMFINDSSQDSAFIIKKIVDGKPIGLDGTEIICGLRAANNYYPDIIGYYKGLNINKPGALYNTGTEVATNLYVKFYNANYYWYDDNYDTIICHYENNIYYLNINLENCLNEVVEYNIEDFTKLEIGNLRKENYGYTLEKENASYKISKNIYYKATLQNTVYYQLQKTKDGGLELIQLDELFSNEVKYIFQPL